MTTLKHILVAALVAAGLTFAAGCQNVPLDSSGKNIGAFNYGEFTGLLNTTATVVAPATHDAIKQLGLVEVAVTDRKFGGTNVPLGSTIVAHDENDLEVTVTIQETNSRQTALHIRWGKGGDLQRSQQLYSLVDAATASQQTTAPRVVR